MAEVRFTLDAVDDIVRLDSSVQPRVLKKILHLEKNPEAGQPLGTRGRTQLATFRKLVVGNRDWRIVYRIEGMDGDLVVIWVVANREDDAVYQEAANRLHGMAEPATVGFEAFIDRLRRRARDIIE